MELPLFAGLAAAGASISLTPFIPTPESVVNAMLQLAELSAADTLCDLGSGDGRVVIAAATTWGARAIGVEINGELVEQSAQRVKELGLEGKVRIEHTNMFAFPLEGVDVVVLYQSELLNRALAAKLKAELHRGARVVSYAYPVPGLRLHQKLEVFASGQRHRIYLYVL